MTLRSQGTKPHLLVTYYEMKARPSLVWTSLTLLALFSLPSTTHADEQGLSLDPEAPRVCDTLTVQWPPTEVPFFSIYVSNRDDDQKLFRTIVDPSVTSIEWVVNATIGASAFHVAVHTPPDLHLTHYRAADFPVLPGPTTYISPSLLPSTPPTTAYPTTSPTTSLNPSTTPSPSTPQPHLSIGTMAGISAGASILVTFLAVSFWYIKRCIVRRRRSGVHVNPFIST